MEYQPLFQRQRETLEAYIRSYAQHFSQPMDLLLGKNVNEPSGEPLSQEPLSKPSVNLDRFKTLWEFFQRFSPLTLHQQFSILRRLIPQWLLRGKRSFRLVFYGLLYLSLTLGLNVCQCITFLAVNGFSKRLSIELNSKMGSFVLWCIQYVFEKRHRAKITWSGDSVPQNEGAIVIANHQSFADFFLIHALAMRKHMLAHCKFFVKDSLKYAPTVGWAMYFVGMVFLKRKMIEDDPAIAKALQFYKQAKKPIWMVSFPEGHRINEERRLKSQTFSQERNLPLLNHVMQPRTKGFVETVKAFRESDISHVYDMTLAFRHGELFNSAPSLMRVFEDDLSTDYDFHVHVRRYVLKELPEEDEALAAWLRDRFSEKDLFLEQMKAQWTSGLSLMKEP